MITGLAAELKAEIRLSSPVRSVAWSDAGVVLHTDTGAVRARRAILAAPPHLVGKIDWSPPQGQLSADERRSSVIACLVSWFGPEAATPTAYDEEDWGLDPWMGFTSRGRRPRPSGPGTWRARSRPGSVLPAR